jgi:peptide/nickel transport system ATP-binding protein
MSTDRADAETDASTDAAEPFDWDYDGPVIEAVGVKKHFPVRTGLVAELISRGETKAVKAVDGVDMAVWPGETMGLVGESGCGKTTLGEVIMGLQEPTAGTVRFLGQDMSEATPEQEKAFRRNVQIIFQNPYESLNPRFTVERWLREPLTIHDIDDQDERIRRALRRAELNPAEQYLDQHPHELSGGQRQRVSIARALVLEPKFIVADEPVSMLDVSVRASILGLLRSLVDDLEMGAIYISHDISLVRQMCDRTTVMYLGNAVERAETERIIKSPKHPYTRALVEAVPVPNPASYISEPQLEGEAPDPVDLPEGCNFRPRCRYATDDCLDEPSLDAWVDPDLAPPGDPRASHAAACWRVDDVDADAVDAAGTADAGDS